MEFVEQEHDDDLIIVYINERGTNLELGKIEREDIEEDWVFKPNGTWMTEYDLEDLAQKIWDLNKDKRFLK